MSSHSLASATTPDLAFISQQLFTAILWVDDSLVIEWINAQVEQLLAISRGRLLGQSILKLLAPEELEHIATNLSITTDDAPTGLLTERFYQAQQYQQPFVTHDHIIDFSSDSRDVLLIDYSVTPVVYQERPYFIVEMWGKDRQSRITEDQRQQQQYEVARQMLRSVAHEVKNPLAGIRGAAQLLVRQFNKIQKLDGDPNALSLSSNDKATTATSNILLDKSMLKDKLHGYTDIIISETDRLTQLIGQLLGSNQPAHWQLINIHQPLEHVLALVLSQYPKVTIKRDYDLSLPELTADKDQLIQVFLNLLNNACESMTEFAQLQVDANYQPQLAIQTRIAFQHTIGQQQHKQVLQLSITDNGGGIESSLLGQIFFPMVTSRAAGTGLGLSIVQDILSRHHGMIEVHSKQHKSGNSTCFTLYLPFSQPLHSLNAVSYK